MFKLTGALIVVLVSAAAHGMKLKVKLPDVTYCADGSDQWFSNINLDITPFPVHVASGEKISIDAGVDILQAVEVGSQLELDMSVKTILGPLHIPCLDIDGLSLGSCTYTVDELLAKATELGICDILMAEGQDCSLPLNPGAYAPGNTPLEITLPDIPAALQPFLKGDITAQAQGIKADGSKIACVELTLELE